MTVAIKIMLLLYGIAFMIMPLSVFISGSVLAINAFRQFREFAKSRKWPDLRLAVVMLIFSAICLPMSFVFGYILYAIFAQKI